MADTSTSAEASKPWTTLQTAVLRSAGIVMSSAMDLLASIAVGGKSISIFRFIAWRRTVTLGENELNSGVVTSIVWSPDGQLLAVGQENGSVATFEIEGTAPKSHFEGGSGSAINVDKSVKAMVWAAQDVEPQNEGGDDEEEQEVAALANTYTDNFHHLRQRTTAPVGAAAQGLIQKDTIQPSAGDDPLTLLATADSSGKVSLCVCGLYNLMSIDFSALRGRVLHPLHISLTKDLQLLTVLARVEPDSDDLGGIESLSIPLPLMGTHRHSIKSLAILSARIRHLHALAEDAVRNCRRLWADALRPFAIKLQHLLDLLVSYGSHSGESIRGDLLMLITCGSASPALAQFFARHLTESALNKTKKGAEAAASSVESLVLVDVCRLSHALLHTATDLGRLSILSTAAGEGGGIGIPHTSTCNLIHICQKFLIKNESLLKEVQCARGRLSDLLEWIYHVAAKHWEGDSAYRGPLDPRLAPRVLNFLRDPLDVYSQTSSSDMDVVEEGGSSVPGRAKIVETVLRTDVEDFFCEPKPDENIQNTCSLLAVLAELKSAIEISLVASPHALEHECGQLHTYRICSPAPPIDIAHTHTCLRCCKGEDKKDKKSRGVITLATTYPSIHSIKSAPGSGSKTRKGKQKRKQSFSIEEPWGKGSRVIITQFSEENTHADVPVRVAIINFDMNITVRQVCFYGSTEGERIVILHEELQSSSITGRTRSSSTNIVNTVWTIVSIHINDLEFTDINPTIDGNVQDIGASVARMHGTACTELSRGVRSGTLPAHLTEPVLSVSGERGAACVRCKVGLCVVLDMEDTGERGGAEEEDGDHMSEGSGDSQ